MKTISQLKWILPLILFVLVATSCGSPLRYQDISRNTKYEVLQFPLLTTPKAYREIIWPEDKQVTAFIYDGYAYIDNQPYVIEGDPAIRYLGLEQDEKCTLKTHYIIRLM